MTTKRASKLIRFDSDEWSPCPSNMRQGHSWHSLFLWDQPCACRSNKRWDIAISILHMVITYNGKVNLGLKIRESNQWLKYKNFFMNWPMTSIYQIWNHSDFWLWREQTRQTDRQDNQMDRQEKQVDRQDKQMGRQNKKTDRHMLDWT